jgi:polyferredoxin
LKVAILLFFLIWMVVSKRPFCRFVCPLGAIWSPFNRHSALLLDVDEERCTRCELCFEVCPMDIMVYEGPNSSQCIRCLECAKVCPVGAIAFKPVRV